MPNVGPMVVRPRVAFAILGIGRSLGFEMLNDGRLERMRLGRRALGVTMRRSGRSPKDPPIGLPTAHDKREERSSDPQLGLALVKADTCDGADQCAQGGIAVAAIL